MYLIFFPVLIFIVSWLLFRSFLPKKLKPSSWRLAAAWLVASIGTNVAMMVVSEVTGLASRKDAVVVLPMLGLLTGSIGGMLTRRIINRVIVG